MPKDKDSIHEKPEENQLTESEIDEILDESFPASDPPPWTLGVKHEGEFSVEDKGDSDKENGNGD